MEGNVGGLFYYEDVDMEIFAVPADYPNTLFVRFSILQEDPGETATVSSFPSQSIH